MADPARTKIGSVFVHLALFRDVIPCFEEEKNDVIKEPFIPDIHCSKKSKKKVHEEFN